MNQLHVMQSASKAVLRASNALDDLHAYLLQLKGHAFLQRLQATSVKASHARELVREIDAALTDPCLILATPDEPRQNSEPRSGVANPFSGSESAAEQTP